MRLMYVLISFGLLISSTCALAQRNNINDLSITDNKYFQNGSPYSGVAYNCYQSGQLKEEFSLMNGMFNGIYATYKIDDRYDKSKYIDTILIAKKIILIEEVKLDISKLKKDSIRSLDSIWILEEELFGGRIFKQLESIEVLKRKEKQKKISEKYISDKLNNKKEGFYNTYADVYKKFQDCTESLATYRFRLKAHNEWLVNEKNKPIYKNILSETFNYERGVQTGTHVVYTKSGDKEVEETLDNGKKNGPYKRYSGSKIVEEGNYVNNEKEGEWTVINSSEKITQNYTKGKLNGAYKKYDGTVLRESGQYIEGLKNGEWKNFDYYGKLLEIKNYKSGKIDGPFKKYSGDVLIEEGIYANGLINGEWKFYYSSGKIKGLGKFLNSDGGNIGSTGIPINGREGIWILYHENGKKSQECSYTNGKENGSFISYHENGNKSQESTYLNGKEDGLFKLFYESGEIKQESTYLDGQFNGQSKTFHENGNLRTIGVYINGKIDGNYKWYREDGTLESSTDYRNGIALNQINFDRSGNKIEKEDSYSSNNTRSNSSYTKTMCTGRVTQVSQLNTGYSIEVDLRCPYCKDALGDYSLIRRQNYRFGKQDPDECDEDEFECNKCGKVSIMKPCLIKHLKRYDKF
jgi:antitoxin component YwqK of YwqJK toxin-antitoxin module